MKKKKKTKLIIILSVLVALILAVLLIIKGIEHSYIMKTDDEIMKDIGQDFIDIIAGDRTSKETTIEQYYENKEVILEVAEVLKKFEKDNENERIEISKEDEVIRLYNKHGFIDITKRMDELSKQKFKKLFDESDYYMIYDNYSNNNSIVFEVKGKAFQFYNGIIVTKDGEEPDVRFGEIDTVEKIEDNVYYFEGE